MVAQGIIGRLRRPFGYVFRFPHASPDGANLPLRAICLSGSWWGFNYIAASRLVGRVACGGLGVSYDYIAVSWLSGCLNLKIFGLWSKI